MPTATKAAPKETWLELLPEGQMPPPKLITRDEMLDGLREDGIDIPEGTLMYWERIGVLPRPIRQWREGSTQALYPYGWGNLVQTVRDRQDQGRSLAEIAREVRMAARFYFTHKAWHGKVYLDVVEAVDALAKLIEEREGFGPIAGVKIAFVKADGEAATYTFMRPQSDDAGIEPE